MNQSKTTIIVNAPFPDSAGCIQIDDELISLNPLRRLGADGHYHEIGGEFIVAPSPSIRSITVEINPVTHEIDGIFAYIENVPGVSPSLHAVRLSEKELATWDALQYDILFRLSTTPAPSIAEAPSSTNTACR